MTRDEMQTLAGLVADTLQARGLVASQVAGVTLAPVPRRMTVIEFAVCVELSAEVVRRRIRSRFIKPEHVEGRPGGLYKIDRAALEKFHVTLEVAAERLQAWRARLQEAAVRVRNLALVPATISA